MKRCPICAEMVDDHLSVCPYCGEPLPGGAPAQNPQPEPSPAETPLAEGKNPEATSTDPGETRFCPVCGERIGAHLTICPVCFEPTNFDQTPVSDQTPPVETPVEQPVETPVEPPAQTPVEPPVQTTVEPPVQTTVEPPVQTPREPEPAIRQNMAPQPEPETQWQPADYGNAAPPPRGGNPLKWLLIALCTLLVIGIGLLAYFLLKDDKADDEPSIDEPKQGVIASSEQPSADQLIKQKLDSVARSLPDEAFAVTRYPDADHQSLFYILDGQLMTYQVQKDATETIDIPVMSGSATVLDMYADAEDKDFLIIEVDDEKNSRTLYYKMNTITQSFEKVGEEATTSGAQSYTAPPSAEEEPPMPSKRNERPKGSWTDEGNYDTPPPPPPHDMRNNNNGRPQRVFRNHDDQRTQDRMERENRRQGDYPPPPPSSGTGFHLEPANPSQGGSSGSGIRLEKVDRIPNQ